MTFSIIHFVSNIFLYIQKSIIKNVVFASNLSEADQYLSIGTFKKSGEVKRTPVWFAQNEGKVYVFTEVNSWKVKRIRNNASVDFTSCNSSGSNLGDIASGTARIMDESEFENTENYFKKKYGLMFKFFKFYGKIKRNENLFLEISE